MRRRLDDHRMTTPWNVIYKTDHIHTEVFLTYEGARSAQERIIKQKDPYWTALVRDRRKDR